MGAYDVLIVGAGPAGSSCAWSLRRSGLKIAILDRQLFPRNKVCGGWVTPAALEELGIEPADYSEGRVMQPITGFRTGIIGGREVETDYGKPVSYGIRRCEFDEYLQKRAGATFLQDATPSSFERSGGEWVVNGWLRTRMLVGAGGTFCPVARMMGAKTGKECAIVAQEAEIEMDESQASRCGMRGDIPELYFCPDLKGYGWRFRKGRFMNLGFGRLDGHCFTAHAAGFLDFLKAMGRLPPNLPGLLGHAYLLYGRSTRNLIEDGVLLIGDAAGLAYSQSGEGIRPAIESGILAGEAIAAAGGQYAKERLQFYGELLARRFGVSGGSLAEKIGQRIPISIATAMARHLFPANWFVRRVVLDRWFLRQQVPVLHQAFRA